MIVKKVFEGWQQLMRKRLLFSMLIMIFLFSMSFVSADILVDPQGSIGYSIAPLSVNTFVATTQHGGQISFWIYNINGSVIKSETDVITGLGFNSRSEVEVLENGNFVISYFSNVGNSLYYAFYDSNGNSLSGVQFLESLDSADNDFSLFHDANWLYIGHMHDVEEELAVDRINITDYSYESELIIDVNAKPETPLDNLVDCNYVNSTLAVCIYYDDGGDDSIIAYINLATFTLISSTTTDVNVGNDASLSGFATNETVMTLVFDEDANNLRTILYSLQGGQIDQNTLDSTIDKQAKVDVALVFDSVTSKYVYVAGWYDDIAGSFKANVYSQLGVELYSYTLSTSDIALYPLFDLHGLDDYDYNGFPQGVYAFGYTNSTNHSLVQFNNLNGSLFDGVIELDFTPPNYSIISPSNDSIFDINANVSFEANFTDDDSLENATLIIKNETGDIISEQTTVLSGLFDSTIDFFKFVAEGVYTFFYNIYDTAGNFVQTSIGIISVDNFAPTIAYEFPSYTDGSIIPTGPIIVNVSAIDTDLVSITIDLNQNGTLIESVNTTLSNFYYEFNSLSDDVYDYNATACDVTGQCTPLPSRYVEVNANFISLVNLYLQLEQYPYLDYNVSTLFGAFYQLAGNPITDGALEIFLVFPNGLNSTYNLTYNPTTQAYENTFVFLEEGGYSFIINAEHFAYGNEQISGAFIVAEAYYVGVEIFLNEPENDFPDYKNRYAVVTAEFTDGYVIDKYLENFIYPVSTYNAQTFHADYDNGRAELKLWERGVPYIIRVKDGEINFNGTYVAPDISDIYNINAYLGTVTPVGQNTTYQFVVDEHRELNQYSWLANWLFVIALFTVVIVSIFMFFILPEHPLVVLTFSIVTTISLIALRIGIWLWEILW